MLCRKKAHVRLTWNSRNKFGVKRHFHRSQSLRIVTLPKQKSDEKHTQCPPFSSCENFSCRFNRPRRLPASVLNVLLMQTSKRTFPLVIASITNPIKNNNLQIGIVQRKQTRLTLRRGSDHTKYEPTPQMPFRLMVFFFFSRTAEISRNFQFGTTASSVRPFVRLSASLRSYRFFPLNFADEFVFIK